MRPVRWWAALVVSVLLAAPGSVVAQSPATSVGLGYPTPPSDARAAALGGAGIGLLDGTFTIGNPADLVEFSEASLSVSAAPEDVSVKGMEGGETGRSRFSAIRAVLPLGEWAASVGFGSELDQDWKFTGRDTLEISSGRFPFEQRRENNGGVSTIDLSVARSVGPVSAGVSYQRLTGSLKQDLVRRFAISVDSAVSAPNPVEERSTFNYSGWRVRAGVGLELGDRVRLGGSYAWTGDLEAERDTAVTTAREIEGESRTFAMPSAASVGASVRVPGDLLVAVSGGWEEWSESAAGLEGDARDVYWGGGGVEFQGLDLGTFPVRLRAGGRWRELPFSLPDRSAPTEQALTFGLGIEFASRRAAIDVAGEIGSRGDLSSTAMEEDFTRFTITGTIRQ